MPDSTNKTHVETGVALNKWHMSLVGQGQCNSHTL